MIVRPLVEDYAERRSTAPSRRLTALAEETTQVAEDSYMMVGPVEGGLLALLVRLLRARRVLEIGTFTGYSALAMAEALPPDGRIVTCEIDPENAAVAGRHFANSPWADRIELVVGPALDTVRTRPGPWDLVFLDADKTGYCGYYDAVLPNLHPDGLLAVDNTLHLGHVAGDRDQSPEVVAIREFNEKIHADDRVEQLVLTVRQGLTLVRRL